MERACQSRRPHSHPSQRTEAELKLIWDMRHRESYLGIMVELWRRLRGKWYTRRPESLFRVMRKQGLFSKAEKKPVHESNPYEQMTYPSWCIQMDVKEVPAAVSRVRRCACFSIPPQTSLASAFLGRRRGAVRFFLR